MEAQTIEISEERTKHKTKRGVGRGVVDIAEPYAVAVTIVGREPMLCHRYDTEVVAQRSGAAKGSKDKKTDNVESYVYRLPDGTCGMPGINFKACICEAAKYTQDPRSPRKSARDLFRAGIKVHGDASFGKDTWDYLDVRKVNIQRNAVTRQRPAFAAGWRLSFEIDVLLPEYIDPATLNEIVVRAGRLVGLGDFRPDFGTFQIERFEVIELGV